MKHAILLSAWACAAACTLAVAQTAPKPAAAAGKTLSLGDSAGAGPLLTREELRACLATQESLHSRRAGLEARRGPLDDEKQGIAVDQQALQAARAPIDELKKKSADFSTRMAAYRAAVQSWNERTADYGENRRSGPQSERKGVELERERQDLEARRPALEAEQSSLSAELASAARAYNTKAQGIDAQAADWNQRNARWNEAALALDAERQTWAAACAARRYREEDEIAIQRGR